jgi:2-succinyl-5-enolpyruvyl-6-hydroxy-3-cyclohexene-1-carboxylate synthase
MGRDPAKDEILRALFMKKEIFHPEVQVFLSQWKNINRIWSLLIIDQLLKNDLSHFTLSPGMRNAPLIKALVSQKEKVHISVGLDERAAAFRALGQSKASGKPGVLICTSGTALANYLPAVIEAKKSGVPLFIISADRPPELVSSDANQSIKQTGLYGDFVKSFLDLGTPTEHVPPKSLTTSICHLAKLSQLGRPGPVHLNVPFREPLDGNPTPFNSHLWPREALNILEQKKPSTQYLALEERTPLLNSEEKGVFKKLFSKPGKGLIVVGSLPPHRDKTPLESFLKEAPFPLYLDVTSSLKYLFSLHDGATPTFDHPEVQGYYQKEKPAFILHFGGRLTSKFYYQFLKENPSIELVTINNSLEKEDPSFQTTYRFLADPFLMAKALLPLIKDSCPTFKQEETELWDNFVTKKRQIIDQAPFTFPALSKTIVELAPPNSTLFLANSTCIRSFDSYSSLKEKKNLKIMSHRGASGIEGMLASSWGYSDVDKGPMTLIIGDISFLHDLNSLSFFQEEKRPFVLIVVNNGGGGIFDLLPISEEKDIMPIISSPHKANFEFSAKQFGLSFSRVKTVKELRQTYNEAIDKGAFQIIEALIDNDVNKSIYKILKTVRLN